MNGQPHVLYHYTCEFHLGSIVRSGMLSLTDNNSFVRQGDGHPVVWMTSAENADNHGLKFDECIPTEFDKTRYRFTIKTQPHFIRWIDWCDNLGIPEESRRCLIESAHAEESYLTWYVSEKAVTSDCWLSIDNIATGKHLWDQGS